MTRIPYVKGRFEHILSPSSKTILGDERRWYINDHCFFVDPENRIHWFGINNPYPEDGHYYAPGTHRHIGHAVADRPFGSWTAMPDAFSLPDDTTECVGACFVAAQGEHYVMLYGFNTGLSTAVSSDLQTWKKQPELGVIDLGPGTRDPCLLKLANGTWLLYCAAAHEGAGAVALASSTDLVTWKQEEPALVSDVHAHYGPLESPFVLEREDLFYLFLNHSHRQYEETLVFESPDPYHFDWNHPICTIFAHAAEMLTWEGQSYISHCGIEDQHWHDIGAPYGLYLAELGWTEPRS